MLRYLTVFAFLFTSEFFVFASPEGYDTVRVSDFGQVVNSRKNSTPIVKLAIEKARMYENPLIIFDAGRYDFWPQHCEERDYYESNTTDNNPKRLGILIEGFDQLVLDGHGAEFVFHDRMQPVTVDNSSNVIIKNFSVDWDIPLTAQAEVIDIDDNSITLKINKYESPYVLEDGKLIFVGEGWKSAITGVMEIEKETRLIAPYTGDSGCCGRGWDKASAEEIEPGVVRVIKSFGLQRPDIGNYLILRHSQRDHAGMFLFHAKNVRIENVRIYHTAGLGILSQFTENIAMDHVKMIPNPNKNRYLSGHDDGFHFSNCKGQISVTNCEFAALMDDPINIHGTSVRIIKKISANKLLCSFMHHQSVGLDWARPGEKIGFISSSSMEKVEFGVVRDFKPLNARDFEIEFVDAVPDEIATLDALENITWTPAATISGNKFMSCRARGILVSTPGRVVIESNYFESSGSAILIAGDANNWYETGAVTDVVIRKNIFADPCLTSLYQFSEAIISIFPEIPNLENSGPKYHRNILIEENEFHPFDYTLLYAKSVDGLVFKNNTIEKSDRFRPFHPRKYTFTFEYCENVELEGNRFSLNVLGMNILLDGTTKKDIKLGKGQLLKLIQGNN
jgi:hypothetical protein